MKEREAFHELRALVQELVAEGILDTDDRGRIGYVTGRSSSGGGKKVHRMTGTLSVNRKGFGFVRVEGMEEDLYISPKNMHTALHGDVVAVVPFARPSSRRRGGDEERVEGEVVEIVQRTLTRVVGRLQQSRAFHFVVPDDQRIGRDIYVADEDRGGARHGDKVVVELLPWVDEALNPEGKVLEVLGAAGDPRVEALSVAHALGLPMHFPAEVSRQAEKLDDGIPEDEIARRVDYRDVVCVTIDPEDARDFDDAVSFEPLENGLMRLGVHIADVSHYVREGTVLDKEALERGTSVYLVNEVIPMLPERLSNDLCSLRPDMDRLTFSAIMDVNPDGKVENYRIAPSIIHSARRFTYEEVEEILQRKKGEHADMLLALHGLTRILLKRRRRNGSIDFDTPEAKFTFDEQGLPSAIIKKVRLEAHRLVEECMLLANKTVAKDIARVRKEEKTKPFIYRVHDAPEPSRIIDLAQFVKQFGFSLNTQGGVTQKSLQKLLDGVKGSEVENVITEVALRSMAKAVYSEKNIGHYGLAFKYYTHFTSPIRRYPDLMVHRLLKEYQGNIGPDRYDQLTKRIPLICKQSSDRERVAVDAERQSVKVMQVEYMKRHIGDEFDGVIGGVTSFGLFIEVNDLLVEGMIRVRDLADDYYLFDEKQHSLRGRNRGKVFRLGDKVRVRVMDVNLEERQINFEILG